MKQILSVFIICLPFLSIAQSLEYPVAEKQSVVDTFYKVPVYDEYRWLENTNDERTKLWIGQQNDLTTKTLKKEALKINSYVAIDKYAYVLYNNPIKQRDYYFTHAYYNNIGAPALFYQKSMRDDPELLVDPNFISAKDNISIKNYSVSKDSKLLAYQFSRNGSDWGEIKVTNMNTEIHLKDHLKNIKFSNIAWKDDGFYYSRFPEQALGETSGQQICFHKIGTEQEQDIVIFKRENNPSAFFSAYTTSDERYLIVKENDEKNGKVNLFYIDFRDSIPYIKTLIGNVSGDDNLSILDYNGKDVFERYF